MIHHGDCYEIMGEMEKESVDLIYMDPPFFMQKKMAAARGEFDDSWADRDEYLNFMGYRLREAKRLLKPTGSIYLHCDYRMSHRLRVLLDETFGENRFYGEIIWAFPLASLQPSRRHNVAHNTIFAYSAGPDYYFDQPYSPHDPEYVTKHYKHDDGDGKGKYGLQSMFSVGNHEPKSNAHNPSPPYALRSDVVHSPTVNKGGQAAPSRKYRDSIPVSSPTDLGKMAAKGSVTQLSQRKGYFYDLGYGEKMPKNGYRMPESTARRWIEEGTMVVEAGKVPVRKVYLNPKGRVTGDVWSDIPRIAPPEYVDYPTQKPERLLLRIVEAACPPDGVVMDPFCGSGTALVAAHRLGRRYIGIDKSADAAAIAAERLEAARDLLTTKETE